MHALHRLPIPAEGDLMLSPACRWWHAHGGSLSEPASLDETRVHAKCLRSKDQVPFEPAQSSY